jgi:Protein of unknown function DUF2625
MGHAYRCCACNVARVRTLAELTDVDDPGWADVTGMIAESRVHVEVLAPDRVQCEASLHQLQVTARSALGAVALNTGGMLVDHGWLRVYGGSGVPGGMPGLAEINRFPAEPAPDGVPAHGLVIAHDVLGGVFALNLATSPACGRPGEPGEVLYFAPDFMRWEPMEGGYGSWLTWMLSDTLGRFYESLRWPGWEAETAALNPRQGLSVIPFLWSREARDDLAATSRRPAAMRELLSMHHEFCRQLTADPDPGFLGTIARPAGKLA